MLPGSGATGATGANGTAGSTGATGAGGPSGSTGATGPQGTAGGSTTFVGNWVTAHAYNSADNRVTNHGSSYSCTQAHTSGSHDDEPGVGAVWQTYWQLSAQMGSTGATGAVGSTGAAGATGAGATGATGAVGATGSAGATGACYRQSGRYRCWGNRWSNGGDGFCGSGLWQRYRQDS